MEDRQCKKGHVGYYKPNTYGHPICTRCDNLNSIKYLRKRGPTYATWGSMKRRCNNPNASNYHLYGGRGIGYTDDWEYYDNFLKDMGERPSSDYSLDRIDNSKGYSKDNCRWATRSEQASNKRSNRFIEYKGKDKTLSEWARQYGISVGTLFARLNVQKWSMEKALNTEPTVGRNQHDRK